MLVCKNLETWRAFVCFAGSALRFSHFSANFYLFIYLSTTCPFANFFEAYWPKKSNRTSRKTDFRIYLFIIIFALTVRNNLLFYYTQAEVDAPNFRAECKNVCKISEILKVIPCNVLDQIIDNISHFAATFSIFKQASSIAIFRAQSCFFE